MADWSPIWKPVGLSDLMSGLGGGAVFGPQPPVPTAPSAMPVPMMPQYASPFQAMVGPAAPTYQPGGENTRFNQAPDDAPEYTTTNVKPIDVMGKAPLGPVQKFSKAKPQPTGKFQKGKLGNYETTDINRILQGLDENAPKWEKNFTLGETALDAAKSLGVGVGEGLTDLLAMPRTLAELPNRLTKKEVIPRSFVEMIPRSSDYKKAAEGVTGPWYKPQTPTGEYADMAGQFLPLLLGGIAGGAIKGGISGGLKGAAVGGAEAGKWVVPTAMAYPIMSGW